MVPFFLNIIQYDNVESTNTTLKSPDFTDKTVIFTFNQTSGRGQRERKWSDFKNKNIALSSVIETTYDDIATTWYTAAASMAVIDLADSLQIQDSWIKWPNDIFFGKKKAAGILTEALYSGTKRSRIITGIGLNVNTTETELSSINQPATSIALATGINRDLQNTVFNLLHFLGSRYSQLYQDGGALTIRDEWIQRCTITGRTVNWQENGQKLAGTVTGISDDGNLLATSDGMEKVVYTGDITLAEEDR
jgi:BirA family biotin operon repressor/biotin-[acetyl-CoA-carboxylase] ligase